MILVIALLTFPATMARQITYNMRTIMLLSIVLGVLFTFSGLWLSFFLSLPSGASIILIGGSALAITFGVSRVRTRRRRRKY